MTVSGTLVSAGKKVKITILPDGTTEEHEEAAEGSYSAMYTSDGRSTSIHIEGDPREFIVDLVKSKVPLPAVVMSALSAAIFFLCHPLVLCAGCCYCCCSPSS